MAAGGGPPLSQPDGSPFRGILIGSALSLMLFGVLYFAYAWDRRQVPVTSVTKVAPAVTEPIDRGNGVYYFPVTGEAYIESLAKFYEGNGKHCDLQGFTEDWKGGAATTVSGFILHCHDLAVNAQDVTIP